MTLGTQTEGIRGTRAETRAARRRAKLQENEKALLLCGPSYMYTACRQTHSRTRNARGSGRKGDGPHPGSRYAHTHDAQSLQTVLDPWERRAGTRTLRERRGRGGRVKTRGGQDRADGGWEGAPSPRPVEGRPFARFFLAPAGGIRHALCLGPQRQRHREHCESGDSAHGRPL